MESRKMAFIYDEFIYRAAMEKQTQKIDLWTWKRGGEGEMYEKSNMET